MKPLLAVLAVVLLAGCKTVQSPMSHAAFRAAVTLGEQIALEQHPEAIPFVRAAVPVVCAVAHSTNVSPAEIVAKLQAAGVTNGTAKLVINGSLAIFNVVVSGSGTNQTEIRLYGIDLCEAMRAGLPPDEILVETQPGRIEKVRAKLPLPPHL